MKWVRKFIYRCHQLLLPRKLSCAALPSSPLRLLISQAREKMRQITTWLSTVQQRTQRRVLEDHMISGKISLTPQHTLAIFNYLLH